MDHVRIKGALALVGVVALVGTSASPVLAASDDVVAEFWLTSGTHREVLLDEECMSIQAELTGEADAEALCTVAISGSVSEARTVTVKDIRNDDRLSAAEKAELEPLAAVAAISSKWYTSNMQGGAYAVTQDGTFYYNKSRVWVTATYSGRTGSQNCFANYFVPPWSVSGFVKADTGSNSVRTVRCDFDVLSAGLFTAHRALIAKPRSNGSVTYSAVL